MHQSLADKCIPVLNRMIDGHNERYPQAQLRPFPHHHRIVHVKPRKELEDQLEMDLSSTSAVFVGSSGRIYINPENLEQEIELYEQIDNEWFTTTPDIPDVATLRLVHLLAHENLHRSCARRQVSPRAARFLRGAYHQLVSETNNKVVSSLLKNGITSVVSQGLSVLFAAKDGRAISKREGLDEFITDWFAAAILGGYLTERGCYPAKDAAFYALIIHRVQSDTNTFEKALSYMIRQPVPGNVLLSGYLSSRMPISCVNAFLKDGQHETNVQAAYAVMLGMLQFLPQVVETVYGAHELLKIEKPTFL